MVKKLSKSFLLVLVIFGYFMFRFVMNEVSIVLYKNGFYQKLLIEPLYFLNFHQPYIVYYNGGNVDFKRGDYESAINSYKRSLEKSPPMDRVCDIRINLALATVYNINTSVKEEQIDALELAKSYLYKDDCAHFMDDNGRSSDAEKLEAEIKQLEKQINNGSKNDDNDDVSDNNDNGDINDDEDKTIEQEILENEKNANSNRQSDLNNYENLNNYDFYTGKRW